MVKIMHKNTVPGTIYLLMSYSYDGQPSSIKLGWTKNLRKRIKQISRWPGEIELLASVPGTIATEQKIHKELRMTGHRFSYEWYSIELKDIAIDLMTTFHDVAKNLEIEGEIEGVI